MIRLILLLRIFIGAVFIAMVAAVFAVSFAAIIYTGELAPYLNKGIGLALLGATILGLLGAFMMSYRGTASQPQDVPAILLAGAASVLAARNQLDGETLFATTVCLIVVSSISMGVAAIFCSRMRLAHLAKYIPYPVMAGFLAATGLLLFLGGVGIAMDESLNLETAMRLFETDNLIRWLPWSIAAILMSIATRVFSGTMTLPICISVMGGLFYLVLWGFGLNLSDARALNLLFGPFGDAWFLAGFSPNVITQADWWAVLTQIPVVLTIIMVSLVSLTLNASGIELETGEDIDLNGDMGSIGVSNIISGFLGGIPGYHHMGETLLSRRLGLKGALAGISCGVGCLLVLLFGTSILSALPMGFFAAVIMFLGLDLLYSW
ncbi:MAG: SulP family inorganic anion transporter, partial [Arenicellales bacterium]